MDRVKLETNMSYDEATKVFVFTIDGYVSSVVLAERIMNSLEGALIISGYQLKDEGVIEIDLEEP